MSFAADLLHFPDLFPVRYSGERWGSRELTLAFAGGPYVLRGLSEPQLEGLRQRYGALCSAGPVPADAIGIKVFRAPESDFRDLDPKPWRDYPLEIDAAADAVRIASRRFVGRIGFYPALHGALWTPVEGPQDDLVGVFENFLRVLAAYRLNELGGVLLHSAGVVHRGRAFLFVGPSGAGKTTIATISQEDGKTVLSDDMNVIRPADGTVVAENLPFAGDLGQTALPLGRYPIGGLFRLEQAAEHSRRSIEPARALAALIANAPFLNSDPHRLDRLADNLGHLLERARLDILAFARDAGFWRLLAGRRS